MHFSKNSYVALEEPKKYKLKIKKQWKKKKKIVYMHYTFKIFSTCQAVNIKEYVSQNGFWSEMDWTILLTNNICRQMRFFTFKEVNANEHAHEKNKGNTSSVQKKKLNTLYNIYVWYVVIHYTARLYVKSTSSTLDETKTFCVCV